MPIRGILLACCARAASGHAAAPVPRSAMNCRRLIGLSQATDHGPSIAGLRVIQARASQQRRAANVRFGSEADVASSPSLARFIPESRHAHPSTHSRLTAPPLLYRRVVTLARVGEILV